MIDYSFIAGFAVGLVAAAVIAVVHDVYTAPKVDYESVEWWNERSGTYVLIGGRVYGHIVYPTQDEALNKCQE